MRWAKYNHYVLGQAGVGVELGWVGWSVWGGGQGLIICNYSPHHANLWVFLVLIDLEKYSEFTELCVYMYICCSIRYGIKWCIKYISCHHKKNQQTISWIKCAKKPKVWVIFYLSGWWFWVLLIINYLIFLKCYYWFLQMPYNPYFTGQGKLCIIGFYAWR